MDRPDGRRQVAWIMAICALVTLAAGSLLVGDLWIGRQTDPYIAEQAQGDAAAYATVLFWPTTIILACLCGIIALLVVGNRKRVALTLGCIGLALIVAPIALADNVEIYHYAPLRGWAAWAVIGTLLIVNACAGAGVWRYVLRRRP